MKKVLILHGWCGDKNENWLPYVKDKLKPKDIEVFIPSLPDTDFPLIETQLQAIKDLNIIFQDGDYLIGHSL